MSKSPVALTSLLLLCGCVSEPQHLDLDVAPASMAFPAGNGQAEVVVVRPGIMGFAVPFHIFVNGDRIGSIRSNDYCEALVDPGVVEVSALAETECRAKFPVEANRSYFLLADPESGWMSSRVNLEVLDPMEGAEHRAECENHTIGAEGSEE